MGLPHAHVRLEQEILKDWFLNNTRTNESLKDTVISRCPAEDTGNSGVLAKDTLIRGCLDTMISGSPVTNISKSGN